MNRTADVVVIGAGVLGAAVLEAIAARGLTGILFEQDLPNRQGSGTTAGNLHIQAIHAERPSQAIPARTQDLVPFQAATSALWRTLDERLDARLDITVAGGLTVAETQEQVDRLHEKQAWEHASGIPTEIIDGAAARERIPALGETVLAATWCPWDGWANNLTVTPAYLAAARRHGASVYVQSPVRAMERVGESWRVRADAIDVTAPVVVDVAGPWLDRVAALAGAQIRMEPTAIQMLETVRVGPRLAHLVQHIGEGLSVKQVDGGAIVIGGGWPAERFVLGGNSPVSDASVIGNLGQVRRILPGLRGVRVMRAWTGPLAATADEMPILGAVDGFSGLYVAGGTYAFTFAPLWAQILAAQILGEQSVLDADRFSPTRLLATTSIGG